MTIHCGYESWKLSQLANGDIVKLENLDTRHEPGWFASDVLLTLGLIGTVAGFILMLAGAFTGIDIANVASVQTALASMAVGMSTALYTTLTGLITSTILKVQYFRLDQDLERYRTLQAEKLVERMYSFFPDKKLPIEPGIYLLISDSIYAKTGNSKKN